MHRQFDALLADFHPRSIDLHTANNTRPAHRPLTYTFTHPMTYKTAIHTPTEAIQHPTIALLECIETLQPRTRMSYSR